MNISKHEIATCACGAQAEIVAQAHHLDMRTNWFVMQHEDGAMHLVDRVLTDDGFRFQMRERVG